MLHFQFAFDDLLVTGRFEYPPFVWHFAQWSGARAIVVNRVLRWQSNRNFCNLNVNALETIGQNTMQLAHWRCLLNFSLLFLNFKNMNRTRREGARTYLCRRCCRNSIMLVNNKYFLWLAVHTHTHTMCATDQKTHNNQSARAQQKNEKK